MQRQINEFMREFIAFEYESVVLVYTERDDALVEARLEDLLARFYALGARPDVYRQPGHDDAYFARAEDGLASVSPRVLFQIKQYDHPELGELYRCYVSHYLHPPGWAVYNANLYVVHSNDLFRIISKYTICPTCNGSDRVNDDVCPDCELDGWNHSSGVEFRELGLLVDILKLRAPDDPTQRIEYGRQY